LADQIRAIYKDAVRMKIFIPREMIFFHIAMLGYTNNRVDLQLSSEFARFGHVY
jgi:hypothetical protein